ncbi:MAG: alpha/beta hydrolase [Oscillospiraceae bacterium]|nr:alpha/beta hydrolase [Oscillospiraceae bacterium]
MFKLSKKPVNISEALFECKRGGLTIRGTEYRPVGDKLPAAIVSHGFMAFQDTVRHYAQALAEMGYLSFCFDFCGGSVVKGKSDGKTTDMSVLTEVSDLEAVIAYVRTLPYADGETILLMGCSQGGFVSGITAAKPENGISKLIMFYPALCIPDDARAGKMMFAKFDPDNIPEIISCGPMKLGRRYVSDVINMNPYDELVGFSGDVLIVHGSRDNIVDTDYSQKAYDLFRTDSARRAELEIIEGGQHGFSKKHDITAIDFIRKFLEK